MTSTGRQGFYDVGVEMELDSVNEEAVLEKLRAGAYEINSRFFHTDAQVRVSGSKLASFLLLSWQLHTVRQVRNLLLSWSI